MVDFTANHDTLPEAIQKYDRLKSLVVFCFFRENVGWLRNGATYPLVICYIAIENGHLYS
jgi:hypothetical protein